MSEQVINRRERLDDGRMRPPITNFIELPPPNYTEPDHPMLVDVVKGKDDENYVFKTLVLSKFTGYVTAFAVLVDATVGTRPKSLAGLLKRVGYWGVPLIGGGIAYTSTVCLISSYRKKHDQYNHFLGGWAVGAVCGACRKSLAFGAVTGVAAGLYGVLYKDSIIHNYEINPNIRNKMWGMSMSHKHDFTLWPEEPKNWTRRPATTTEC